MADQPRTILKCEQLRDQDASARGKFWLWFVGVVITLTMIVGGVLADSKVTDARHDEKIAVGVEKVKSLEGRTDNIEKNMARQVRLLEDIHDEVVTP